MNDQPLKILLTVDGSRESLEAVRYVSLAVQPARAEIVLFSVLPKAPDVFWDSGAGALSQQKLEAARKWEKKQYEHLLGFMASAAQIFEESGFQLAQITTRINPQQEGIARDIIAESRQDYDILAIGRGRAESLPGQMLGSVASKVISAQAARNIWLIGSKPNAERILVALDHSDNALKVVEHAAATFNRGRNDFTLFHAIRGIAAISPPEMIDLFPLSYQQQLIRDAEWEMQPTIIKAEALLNEFDIAPERIASKFASGVRSRAVAVLEEAKRRQCGTIVVGRRGATEVRDFSMGRVTTKLIQLASEQTICIVG